MREFKSPEKAYAAMHAIGLVMTLVVAGAMAAEPTREPPRDRWVYLQTNLQVANNLPGIEQMLARASRAGYNGVVLADYKLNILDRVPEHYFKNAAKFREICRENRMEIIPAVAGFGYSSGILAHDPNLAEALPVREAPLVVNAGRGISSTREMNLAPGEFEQRRGHVFSGWNLQDEPGMGTFADESIRHGGEASLRIENPPGVRGNRRVNKLVTVRPWAQYHASVWVRTEGFESAGETRMFAMGMNGRVLAHSNLGVKRDQEWTQHHVIFNSLDNSQVRFYLGAWDCGAGRAWLDDCRLVECPFVNLVRRNSCPLVVRDETKTTVYEEGRDYAKLQDTRLGVTPWPGEFDVFHEPPTLEILPGSRIADGQKLLVDYYHAVTIYDQQVPCSLSDPKVFEIVEDQVTRVARLFEPKTYFLSHDEIRVANWSQADQASGKTAGQQLASNVRRCGEIVRKVTPGARLCVWSDMFDPHHNAVSNYYLVNGDFRGSWEGLPENVTIVNWNSGHANESLAFFANRSHPQILAGYYDGPPERIRDWMATAGRHGGPRGVMYTTWKSNFSQLEKFAEAAWGGSAGLAR
jgi:hypothetical protein